MTELATSAYALLTDGTEIEIRGLRPSDAEAVQQLHRQLSPQSLYLRFFSLGGATISDQMALRLCRHAGPGHGAVSAWLAGELVGVAGYESYEKRSDVAEIALAVADRLHHRGVGTLLLEHLGSLARARGIVRFQADILMQNYPMLRVIRDAGFDVRHESDAGVMEVTLVLEPGERYLNAVAERERSADVASLAHLFRPSSIAVIGAGHRPGTVGHEVLRSLRISGFSGAVHAVNPHLDGRLMGADCFASVEDLPEPPELAVIAVPAAQVPDVARACGRRGTRALVVISSGLTGSCAQELQAICHDYGMRMVGPNCLGIANTELPMNTTFAIRQPRRGVAGVAVQSGGVGVALMEQLSRLGIGVSSFVSMGDKYDVSATDLIQWWESDGVTRLGLMHVESFGNPRKFARTARLAARTMPLLTVLAGRSAEGRRAAASHTAAAATPTVTQEALFAQAGIIATHTLGDLVGAAALLGSQPVPAGPRIAIVSNAGGAGVLAADACTDAGLEIATLGEATQAELAAILPTGAACAGPVDTTPAVDSDLFRRCLDLVAADEDVDAVIAVICPTAISSLKLALTKDIPGHKTVAGVLLDQAESVTLHDGRGIPCYSYPEDAARALGHAWSYGKWLAWPTGQIPDLEGLDEDAVHALISDFLAGHPDGGWLSPPQTMALLRHYGLPIPDWYWATSMEEAARAYLALGDGRVVMKAHLPGVIHKSRAGAVKLDLYSADMVRQAYEWFDLRFGDDLQGVLIQPMESAGVEVLCGVVQEPVFGPLVMFGLGGTDSDALDDRTARLTPVTDIDAAEMTGALRASSLLTYQDTAGVQNILLRLGRLADDHPQIAELDLNPVLVRSDSVAAVDARIRILPADSRDPYLRKLR